MADISQVCRRPVFQDLDLTYNVGVAPGAVISRRPEVVNK